MPDLGYVGPHRGEIQGGRGGSRNIPRNVLPRNEKVAEGKCRGIFRGMKCYKTLQLIRYTSTDEREMTTDECEMMTEEREMATDKREMTTDKI